MNTEGGSQNVRIRCFHIMYVLGGENIQENSR